MATRKRVGVVGTGTVGSQAAWPLAVRGAEVVAYDPREVRTAQPIDFISTLGRTSA